MHAVPDVLQCAVTVSFQCTTGVSVKPYGPLFVPVTPRVSFVSDYGLDDRDSIPAEAEDFSSSLCIQTGSGAHPASCPVVTGGSFPGGKARPGRDVDHSPPSSAEVKYE
jgi:hypothetical protein